MYPSSGEAALDSVAWTGFGGRQGREELEVGSQWAVVQARRAQQWLAFQHPAKR